MKFKVLLSVALACLVAMPVIAQGGRPSPQDTAPTYWSPYPPPKPLRNVQGHWTPYFPPDPHSFPADANVHTIGRGETLWGLAHRFYGDNLLWPFLWENNTYITDPHWIYPGDPLYVPPLIVIDPGELERVEDFEAPDLGEVFMPAGSMSNMYCPYFIAPYRDEKMTDTVWSDWDMFLIGSEESLRLTHSEAMVMYMNRGSADGIQPGQEFAVMSWDREIKHPIFQDDLGEIIRTIGSVRVLCTQENTSTVVVTHACDSIEPGQRLKPWSVAAAPLRPIEPDFQRNCVEPNPYGRGYVVYLDGDRNAGATWDRVSIDLGSQDGVLPGDTFLVYRDSQNDPVRLEFENYGKVGLERYNKRPDNLSWWHAENIIENAYPARKRGPFETQRLYKEVRTIKQPRRMIAELVVLSTEDATSTAVVSYAVQEVYPGDKIELKAGQPVN